MSSSSGGGGGSSSDDDDNVEFDARGRRRRQDPQRARDEALYGYQSSDDGFEGGRGSGSGRKRKRRRRGIDDDDEIDDDAFDPLSRPVGFVSAGVASGSDRGDVRRDEESESPPSFARPGLGAARQQGRGVADDDDGLDDDAAPRRFGLGAAVPPQSNNDDDLDDDSVLPGAFGASIKAAARARQEEKRRQQQQQQQRQRRQPSASASKAAASAASTDIGSFEKHTKGIGSKLLAKMGYKPGEGLGKDGKGISRPVEAVVRPKGAGLGVGGKKPPAPTTVPAPSPSSAVPVRGGGGRERGSAGQQQRSVPASNAAAAAALRRGGRGGGGTSEGREQAPLWKSRDSEKRAKRTYRTAEEVLSAEGGGEGAEATRATATIVDMRGAGGPRVVRASSGLRGGTNDEIDGGGDDDDLPMPELQHNLRLLVRFAEADIARRDAALRSERDAAVAFEAEAERAAAAAEAAEREASRLDELLSGFEAACKVVEAPSSITLAECRELLSAGERAFSDLLRKEKKKAPTPSSTSTDFSRFGLGAAAAAALLPALSSALSRASWPEPLKDPSAGGVAAALARWRTLVEGNSEGHHHHRLDNDSSSFCPYSSLLDATLLPRLASMFSSSPSPSSSGAGGGAIDDGWDPVLDASGERSEDRGSSRCSGVALLETWEAAVPAGVLSRRVAEAVVLPRLERSLREWEWEWRRDEKETKKARPLLPLPHSWIHPWLPWIPEKRLAELWPSVRQKLSSSLERCWQEVERAEGQAGGGGGKDGVAASANAAALALLRPWRAIFSSSPSSSATSSSQWDRLLSRAVLPRLRRLLSPRRAGGFFEIDPSSQDLRPWHSAMALAVPLLDRKALSSLLCDVFFPQWHSVLRAWLSSPDADFGEVAAWYEGWKALLPEAVSGDGAVRAQLESGLAAMEAALSGEALPAAPPVASSEAKATKSEEEEPGAPAPPTTTTTTMPSLRSLVEAFAADVGLDFAPAAPAGRRHAGLPVYLLGGVPIVLDTARSTLLAKIGAGGGVGEGGTEGSWKHASLEDVAAEARRRSSESRRR